MNCPYSNFLQQIWVLLLEFLCSNTWVGDHHAFQQRISPCSRLSLPSTSRFSIRDRTMTKAYCSLLQLAYHPPCYTNICCYTNDRDSSFQLGQGMAFLCNSKLLSTQGGEPKQNCRPPNLAKMPGEELSTTGPLGSEPQRVLAFPLFF